MLTTMRNAWKIDDLRRKMLYTLFILFIFRIGSAIPVPFINRELLVTMMDYQREIGGFLGQMDVMSGGALSQATLFALGISPYITSSIVIQLLTVAIPYLENLSKEGPEGRKKLNIITRYVTLALAVLQAGAYYLLNRNTGTLEYSSGGFAGTFSAIVIIAAFAAGAMIVVWLGERIDEKGIGNGISLILFVGIVARGPKAVKDLIMMIFDPSTETITKVLVPISIVIFIFMIFAIVIMTNAERRIPVQYAKRVVGRKMYGGQSSYLPIKVTMSGVMPVIFAGAILGLPSMLTIFATEGSGVYKFLSFFNYTSPVYGILYFFLIIGFNYFYVAIQYDPLEMANDLRKNSGTIPGIRPGQPTADFIAKVISRITLVGALFIALLALLPIIAGYIGKLPIALGGTSIIIVVNVALDVVQSLEAQMMMRHYKGFLE